MTCDAGRSQATIPSSYTPSGIGCAACEAGKAASNGSTACEGCTIGRYQPESPATAYFCITCGEGRVSVRMNATECEECSQGKHETSNHTECKDCEEGKAQPQSGQSSCEECPDGEGARRARLPGAITCENCANGTYNMYPLASDTRNNCRNCPSGYYQNKRGQIECLSCPVGYSGNGYVFVAAFNFAHFYSVLFLFLT